MKLWEKNYKLDKEIEAFTVGSDPDLDLRLIKYDCIASIAHAQMLGKIGSLSKQETTALSNQLHDIIQLAEKGEFKIAPEEEDCHTAIENHLTRKLGETGKKIHTFRSRNDQVSTALRLYYKDELNGIMTLIRKSTDAFITFRQRYGKIKIPGFTHTRKAMPSSIGIWVGAFIDSMGDNLMMLEAVMHLIDQSPLGTGAGYGLPYEIDRQYTASKMGFSRIQMNPLYTQNSRGKFEAVILNCLSLIMLDLNKLASDLILFTLPEFAFFKIPDQCLTGSSIMPHKKNPDLLEILRANYHQVAAYETQVKGIAANLISGYHRDLQLTKEPVMKGFDITRTSLNVVLVLINKLKANRKACEAAITKDIFATERAYQLVKAGMPFRDAYRAVAKKLA